MLQISIDWPYFLGIMGSLVLIAWYSNSRFTALETSMGWVKDTLHDLKVGAENTSSPTVVSPIAGEEVSHQIECGCSVKRLLMAQSKAPRGKGGFAVYRAVGTELIIHYLKNPQIMIRCGQ